MGADKISRGQLGRIVDSFHEPLWLDEANFRRIVDLVSASDTDLELFVERAETYLSKRRPGHAANWLAVGLKVWGDRFLNLLRRKGSFRPSKYGFDGASVDRTARTLLRRAETCGLSEAGARYFLTVARLCEISKEVAKKRQELLTFLRANRQTALKSFIALVDLFFMMDWGHERGTNPHTIYFYSKEELSTKPVEPPTKLVKTFLPLLGLHVSPLYPNVGILTPPSFSTPFLKSIVGAGRSTVRQKGATSG